MSVQCDIGVLRHDGRNRGMALEQSPAVVPGPEPGNDGPVADFAHETVRKNALYAIARLDPDLSLLQRQDDEDPLVLALPADAPGRIEAVDVAVEFIVADGDERCHHDGRAGFFEDFPGQALHPVAVFGRDHTGKVVHRPHGPGEVFLRLRHPGDQEQENRERRDGDGLHSSFHGDRFNRPARGAWP